jgi:DNA-binding ferritin-like protein
MTMISSRQQAINRMGASQADLNVGIFDAMAASAEDTWSAGPTMALARAAASMGDRTGKISSKQANEMYGLTGTEAEVGEDEEMTFESAEARARDFHQKRMNQIIQETVNEDSSIMGNVTQFAASIGASLVDPTLIVANVAGAALVGAGGAALAAGARTGTGVAGRMFNGIANASPAAAKGLLAAYDATATRSLMTVVAREGLENFAGSLIEEATIQGALTIGDERLSRKYSWQDSIQNIIVGTGLGTGIGTLLSKDGRKALADGFLMDWGDDASEFLKANSIISTLEANAGHEKGRLEIDFMNRERFGVRPWYNEKQAPFSMHDPSTKVYLSVDEKGAFHTFSNRGPGSTLTSDKIHAMNSGSRVIEVDTSNLRLLTDSDIAVDGKRTVLGQKIAYEMGDNFATHPELDMAKLTRAIEVFKNPDADLNVQPMSRKVARAEVRKLLEGKGLDEVLKTLVKLGAMADSAKFNPLKSLDDVLAAEGFDGHVFAGKNFDGKDAYRGVYVNQASLAKLQKSHEFPVPKPTEGQKVLWRFEQEQMYKKHVEWVKQAKSLTVKVDDLKEQLGLPKETPIEDVATKVKQDHVQEVLNSTKERQETMARVRDELKAELEEAKANGKELDEDDAGTLALLEEISNGTDIKSLSKKQLEIADGFISCVLSGLKG